MSEALPLIKLETPHLFYDYDAKYVADDTRYLIPCGLDAADEAQLQALALQAFGAVGASGWGRVDILIDEHRQALADRGQHGAGDDQSQPGADGGQGGRHRFRRTGLAHPCADPGGALMAAHARQRTSRAKAQPQRRPWVMPLLAAAAMLMISGGLFATYSTLSQPGRLPLRVIEIQGEFRQLEHAAIERTVMATIDGGFFSCDMQKLREAVLQMPWVDDVSIRRGWPDKLSMKVTEQVPLARWGDDALINVAGGVFRPDSIEAFSSLVKLSGPQGSEQRVVAFYLQLVPAARCA